MMKYSEFWELQDACSAELDEFAKRYEDAKAKEKTAESAAGFSHGKRGLYRLPQQRGCGTLK